MNFFKFKQILCLNNVAIDDLLLNVAFYGLYLNDVKIDDLDLNYILIDFDL